MFIDRLSVVLLSVVILSVIMLWAQFRLVRETLRIFKNVIKPLVFVNDTGKTNYGFVPGKTYSLV